MDLVDDGVGVAVPGPGGGVGPVEGGVDHQAPGIARRSRAGLPGRDRRRRGPGPPARTAPPGRGPRVGVEQQLGRVAAHPAGRVPGAGGAVAVRLAGAHPLDEAVPDPGVVLRQGDPGLGAGVVEQAQQHPLGHARRHREVGPARARVAPSGAGGTPSRRPWRRVTAALSTTSPKVLDGDASPADGRPRMRSATRPSIRVWCEAPSPALLSPWKYSLKTRLPLQAGSRWCGRPFEAGPPPVRPDDEQVDQPLAQAGGDLVEGVRRGPPAALDGELVAEERQVALEGADQQVVEREPDGPAPVGVPPNIPVVDSAGS